MLQGAELILVPNACPMEINRLAQLRAAPTKTLLAPVRPLFPEDFRIEDVFLIPD